MLLTKWKWFKVDLWNTTAQQNLQFSVYCSRNRQNVFSPPAFVLRLHPVLLLSAEVQWECSWQTHQVLQGAGCPNAQQEQVRRRKEATRSHTGKHVLTCTDCSSEWVLIFIWRVQTKYISADISHCYVVGCWKHLNMHPIRSVQLCCPLCSARSKKAAGAMVQGRQFLVDHGLLSCPCPCVVGRIT